MSLAVSFVSVAKDGKTITFSDASSAPSTTSASITWKYWTAAAFTTPVVLSAPQLAALKTPAGFGFTPDLVGLTAIPSQAFADGIHIVRISVDAGMFEYKVLVRAGAEACIVGSIGKLTEKDCDCGQPEKSLQKLIRWRFAADVKRDLADYDAAHNLVVSIGKYCGQEDCNC